MGKSGYKKRNQAELGGRWGFSTTKDGHFLLKTRLDEANNGPLSGDVLHTKKYIKTIIQSGFQFANIMNARILLF